MEKSNKFIVRILIVALSLIIFFNKNLKSQEYIYIGKDSIKIIHRMMEYHLDFMKDKIKFEIPTFEQKKDRSYSLKQLYDSLNKLYVPFQYFQRGGDLKLGNGFYYSCDFLIDSNTLYRLMIFIPDSLFIKSSFYNKFNFKNKFNPKLLDFEDFGVVAYKDKEHLKFLNDLFRKDPAYLDDDEFYQEYLKLLKKMYMKQKDKKCKK